MKIKTSELTGAALDWAVSTIENQDWDEEGHIANIRYPDDDGWVYAPSTNWSQGGPIIEREGVHLLCDDARTQWTASACESYAGGRRLVGWRKLAYGPTPLIAAMRCFCCRLGDVVDIPEELCQQQSS